MSQSTNNIQDPHTYQTPAGYHYADIVWVKTKLHRTLQRRKDLLAGVNQQFQRMHQAMSLEQRLECSKWTSAFEKETQRLEAEDLPWVEARVKRFEHEYKTEREKEGQRIIPPPRYHIDVTRPEAILNIQRKFDVRREARYLCTKKYNEAEVTSFRAEYSGRCYYELDDHTYHITADVCRSKEALEVASLPAAAVFVPELLPWNIAMWTMRLPNGLPFAVKTENNEWIGKNPVEIHANPRIQSREDNISFHDSKIIYRWDPAMPARSKSLQAMPRCRLIGVPLARSPITLSKDGDVFIYGHKWPSEGLSDAQLLSQTVPDEVNYGPRLQVSQQNQPIRNFQVSSQNNLSTFGTRNTGQVQLLRKPQTGQSQKLQNYVDNIFIISAQMARKMLVVKSANRPPSIDPVEWMDAYQIVEEELAATYAKDLHWTDEQWKFSEQFERVFKQRMRNISSAVEEGGNNERYNWIRTESYEGRKLVRLMTIRALKMANRLDASFPEVESFPRLFTGLSANGKFQFGGAHSDGAAPSNGNQQFNRIGTAFGEGNGAFQSSDTRYANGILPFGGAVHYSGTGSSNMLEQLDGARLLMGQDNGAMQSNGTGNAKGILPFDEAAAFNGNQQLDGAELFTGHANEAMNLDGAAQAQINSNETGHLGGTDQLNGTGLTDGAWLLTEPAPSNITGQMSGMEYFDSMASADELLQFDEIQKTSENGQLDDMEQFNGIGQTNEMAFDGEEQSNGSEQGNGTIEPWQLDAVGQSNGAAQLNGSEQPNRTEDYFGLAPTTETSPFDGAKESTEAENSDLSWLDEIEQSNGSDQGNGTVEHWNLDRPTTEQTSGAEEFDDYIWWKSP